MISPSACALQLAFSYRIACVLRLAHVWVQVAWEQCPLHNHHDHALDPPSSPLPPHTHAHTLIITRAQPRVPVLHIPFPATPYPSSRTCTLKSLAILLPWVICWMMLSVWQKVDLISGMYLLLYLLFPFNCDCKYKINAFNMFVCACALIPRMSNCTCSPHIASYFPPMTSLSLTHSHFCSPLSMIWILLFPWSIALGPLYYPNKAGASS